MVSKWPLKCLSCDANKRFFFFENTIYWASKLKHFYPSFSWSAPSSHHWFGHGPLPPLPIPTFFFCPVEARQTLPSLPRSPQHWSVVYCLEEPPPLVPSAATCSSTSSSPPRASDANRQGGWEFMGLWLPRNIYPKNLKHWYVQKHRGVHRQLQINFVEHMWAHKGNQ
jgi:hypothetical protein